MECYGWTAIVRLIERLILIISLICRYFIKDPVMAFFVVVIVSLTAFVINWNPRSWVLLWGTFLCWIICVGKPHTKSRSFQVGRSTVNLHTPSGGSLYKWHGRRKHLPFACLLSFSLVVETTSLGFQLILKKSWVIQPHRQNNC